MSALDLGQRLRVQVEMEKRKRALLFDKDASAPPIGVYGDELFR
jgi:hypothetical protein